VHRVMKTPEGLAELYVTVGSTNEFDWTTDALSTEGLAEFCGTYVPGLAPGQTIEVNLAIDDWLQKVAAKLSRGFVITVDYGEEARDLYDNLRRPKGSLRAFSQHGFVDSVLNQPGAHDITSTINWTQVKSAGEKLGFKVVQFSSQDKFLLNAGLLDVLEQRLTKIQSEGERLSLTSGAREMILPGGMAASFQVLVQQRALEGVANVAVD
jgi:SAM-dependent MidA family methyltransferase